MLLETAKRPAVTQTVLSEGIENLAKTKGLRISKRTIDGIFASANKEIGS